ncbi:MAG: transglutaminase TgpA family protein [Pyrinomonadaceae bacterium]
MSFETYFKTSSYAMVASGTLALAVVGGIGAPLAALFFFLLAVAWKCNGRRWQLSSRTGLFIVLLSLPLFYLDWKFQFFNGTNAASPERAGISSLTHFILFLSLVKLWQSKADRDWLFLYLLSFFEILLAAGLSIRPEFLLLLGLYVLCAISTVVTFEIRKAQRLLGSGAPPQPAAGERPRQVISFEPTWLRRATRRPLARHGTGEIRRLPALTVGLLLLIFSLALPVFFVAPRFQGSALTRAGGGGLSWLVGFSDEVTIGEIAKLERSDQLVMRVRVDDTQAALRRDLRWRGVALDQFDGKTWRRSNTRGEFQTPDKRGLVQFDTVTSLDRLTTQTFFIEPVDTPVLFIAPRAVAVQGALPYVGRDREDGLTTRDHSQERIAYRAFSDTIEPPADQLRADLAPYARPMMRYLEVPDGLDPRIADLTRGLIVGTGASNRYDAARAVEDYLGQSSNFAYSLDLKAGGDEPLSDFLFRVRSGNCEYFATSMAVMLRTAGVATRIVNGFQRGAYNEAANAFSVRQSDAHSWVEVYFPETGAWVTFDPTPASAREDVATAGGFGGQLHKYAEAFELFWIQYVVSYDKQEQRSLASVFRDKLSTYRLTAGQALSEVRSGLSDWWRQSGGGSNTLGHSRGWGSVTRLVLLPLLALSLVFAALRLRGKPWPRFARGQAAGQQKFQAAIVFYERMTQAFARRGFSRGPDQTPLEFAAATGVPEALLITDAYNRVRYGSRELSPAEAAHVEEWLKKIEKEVNRES